MFDLFGYGKQIEQIDQSVAESFSKVKKDTDALYQWVSFLHQENQQLKDQNHVLRRLIDEQKLTIHEFRVAVQHMPKTPAEIKALVDAHYSLEPILQRMRHIEQKIDAIELRREQRAHALHPLEQPSHSVQTHQQPVQHVSPPVVNRAEEAKSALKERMIRKLARNSKDYIKNLVLGLVHKYNRMGALQLREIIVEEQGLCSKSSFYRILEEMEDERSLQVVSDGKHTIYIAAVQQDSKHV